MKARTNKIVIIFKSWNGSYKPINQILLLRNKETVSPREV